MDQLPPEIIREILSYMNHLDRALLMRTNLVWYHLVKSFIIPRFIISDEDNKNKIDSFFFKNQTPCLSHSIQIPPQLSIIRSEFLPNVPHVLIITQSKEDKKYNVEIWDIEKGIFMCRLLEHIVYLPSSESKQRIVYGKYIILISSCRDHRIQIFNVFSRRTYQLVYKYKWSSINLYDKDEKNSVQIHGNFIINQIIEKLHGKNNNLQIIGNNPFNQKIITSHNEANYMRIFKILDVDTTSINRILRFPNENLYYDISSDGRVIVYDIWGTIEIYNDHQLLVSECLDDMSHIRNIRWTCDNKYIISLYGIFNDCIKIIKTKNLKIVLNFHAGENILHYIYSPKDKSIMAIMRNKIEIWDIRSIRLIQRIDIKSEYSSTVKTTKYYGICYDYTGQILIWEGKHVLKLNMPLKSRLYIVDTSIPFSFENLNHLTTE